MLSLKHRATVTIQKRMMSVGVASDNTILQYEKAFNLNYVVPSIGFQPFLYGNLKLSSTLENLLCYCYTSYEMRDQFL